MTDNNVSRKQPIVVNGVTFPDSLGLHELRVVDAKGRTYALLLDVKQISVDKKALPGMDSISLSATVRNASQQRGVDYRLQNQRNSIQELLDHLRHHCPALRVAGADCDYPRPMPATAEEVNRNAAE